MATAGVTNWSIPKRWLWKLPIFHQTAARALHPQDEHCMGHQVPCVSQLWPAWGPPQASVFPPHSLLAQRCDSTPQKHASLPSHVSVLLFFYQVNSCEGMKCDRSYLHDTVWISLILFTWHAVNFSEQNRWLSFRQSHWTSHSNNSHFKHLTDWHLSHCHRRLGKNNTNTHPKNVGNYVLALFLTHSSDLSISPEISLCLCNDIE